MFPLKIRAGRRDNMSVNLITRCYALNVLLVNEVLSGRGRSARVMLRKAVSVQVKIGTCYSIVFKLYKYILTLY